MNPTKRKLSLVLLCSAALFSGVGAQTNHGAASHTQHGSSHKENTQEPGFSEREQAVMPFDVTATLHVFTDTATGGVQQVVADDPNDAENIALIRSHLVEEATRFASGDFTDPGYLHGETMPGLAELTTAGAGGRLRVGYSAIDRGGQIVFASADPDVIIALHLWFQAQVTDHGEHASN